GWGWGGLLMTKRRGGGRTGNGRGRSKGRARRGNTRGGEGAVGRSDTSAAKKPRRSVRGQSRYCDLAQSGLTGIVMTKAVLGVIGGSGIYDLPGLEKVRQRAIKSPWGEPSAPLRVGEIAGTPGVFLSRHDTGHRLSPSDINYRAHIHAL